MESHTIIHLIPVSHLTSQLTLIKMTANDSGTDVPMSRYGTSTHPFRNFSNTYIHTFPRKKDQF